MIVPPWHSTTWHNGRSVEPHPASDHAQHDGHPAPRAFVPPQHNRLLHDGNGQNGRGGSPLIDHTNGTADHVAQRPNGLRFTRAAPLNRDVVRVHLDAKIAPILSTRSGVGCKRGLGLGMALLSLNPVFDYSRWMAIDSHFGIRKPCFVKPALFLNRYRLNISARCKDVHQIGHRRVFAHY